MSPPKTLAERLNWMAKNLPGFAQELDAIAAIKRATTCGSSAVQKVHTVHDDAVARIADYATTDTASRLDLWAHPDRHFMRNDSEWSSVYTSLLNSARPT